MRILLIHPNYHSGGAEIAGNWPPAWAAYISGALKGAGFADVQFIDAMTFEIPDDRLETMVRDAKPDLIMATAITPAIYKAMATLEMCKRVFPTSRRCSAACTARSCIVRSSRKPRGST